tara:strand:+ start:7363 stop:7881 length:519 start_codon:yes stop_codon:yes gene_type:complete
MVKNSKRGGAASFKIGRKNVNVKWTRPYILNKIAGLCPPAALYLVLSSLSFLGILFQNCNDSTKYIIGDMMVDAPCHNAWFFVGKLLYILIWTWLLNMLCNKGFSSVSWFLVLLPFIAMFMILGMMMIILMKQKKEGFREGNASNAAKSSSDGTNDYNANEDEEDDTENSGK